jgi:hypothetical protein
MKSIMQMHENTALPSTNDAALESPSGSSLGVEAAMLAASWEDLDSKLDAGEQTCIFGGGSFAILPMTEQRSGIPNMTMQKMSVEFEGDISCMNSAAALHFFPLSKALLMLVLTQRLPSTLNRATNYLIVCTLAMVYVLYRWEYDDTFIFA